jgi:hypothetical protein
MAKGGAPLAVAGVVRAAAIEGSTQPEQKLLSNLPWSASPLQAGPSQHLD